MKRLISWTFPGPKLKSAGKRVRSPGLPLGLTANGPHEEASVPGTNRRTVTPTPTQTSIFSVWGDELLDTVQALNAVLGKADKGTDADKTNFR